jgi:hypothetical protein
MNNKYLDFFCTLCWRPVNSYTKKHKLCEFHRQPSGASEYKKRRRLLIEVAKSYEKELPVNEIFNALMVKIKSPEAVNRELTKSLDTKSEKVRINDIAYACCKNYENYVAKFQGVDVSRFTNIVDWGKAIIRVMDKEHHIAITRAWEGICTDRSQAEQRMVLLHLISRIEIEEKLFTYFLKAGPFIGTVKMNYDIMRSLITAYDEKQELGISVNLSDIARIHSVSRQTVHEKWKRFLKNQKVYRKVFYDDFN